ncbi:MAG TPA: glycosyltransferase family 4 protein [Candidatus Saccharimonadales bacterium]|jgi:glycosyltransferase involved in cell wall biosynthesis|nr:glycosyltransferase family 4 protein [Candidatus Saccharimonadales bacterium]
MVNKKPKKQKILVVCQHFWPETFRISDICEGLVEQGYEVEVLCGIPNYPAGKFFKGYGFFSKKRQLHNGVSIIRVPEIPRGNNSMFRILVNYVSFPFFALFYVPMLARRKYDRILVYGLSPVFMAFPAIVLAKLKKIKLYIYVMDFWPHSVFSMMKIKSAFLRSVITKVSYWHYRQADGVIGLYKGTQTRLINDIGVPAERTIYIPQAPEKFYEQDVYDKGFAERFKGTFNIVFAGNINPAQCFDVLLGAVKKLDDDGFHNFRFIVLGDGMSKKWVVEEVERLGLTGHFVFEGLVPVEEVPKYHTIADGLIVALSRSPLFDFSVPAKVYSYLASGRPIMAAIDGESQRIINQSGGGICVDSGDTEGLYKALKKITGMTKAERTKMGKRGREYHFKYYERNYNLRRLIDFVCNDTVVPDTEYDAIS